MGNVLEPKGALAVDNAESLGVLGIAVVEGTAADRDLARPCRRRGRSLSFDVRLAERPAAGH